MTPSDDAVRALYIAANDVCACAGFHGQISGRDDRIVALMAALHSIDGGTFDPALAAHQTSERDAPREPGQDVGGHLFRQGSKNAADEMAKFKSHSVLLNKAAWKMLEYLGDVVPNDVEHFGDVGQIIDRFFAALKAAQQPAPTEKT